MTRQQPAFLKELRQSPRATQSLEHPVALHALQELLERDCRHLRYLWCTNTLFHLGVFTLLYALRTLLTSTPIEPFFYLMFLFYWVIGFFRFPAHRFPYWKHAPSAFLFHASHASLRERLAPLLQVTRQLQRVAHYLDSELLQGYETLLAKTLAHADAETLQALDTRSSQALLALVLKRRSRQSPSLTVAAILALATRKEPSNDLRDHLLHLLSDSNEPLRAAATEWYRAMTPTN